MPDSWLRGRAQVWLDRRVAESTAAREALLAIDGRCFAVHLEGIDIQILLAAGEGGLQWLEPGVREPDATLYASPLDALALARSQSLAELKRTDARLEGNIGTAEKFAAALARLSPDIEAELAAWVGDIAAHEVATAGHRLADFARHVTRVFANNTTEFLQHERPMLARPEEVAEFTEAVDDLRDAVERAASRLTALENGQQSVRRPTAVSATDAMAQQSADAGGPAGSE